MIKQIFDDDYTLFSNLKSNHYSRRIISHYDAYGIKPGLCRKLKLSIGSVQPFLKSVLLPLIYTVSAVAAHKIASAQSWVRIIPFPCSFFTPSHVR